MNGYTIKSGNAVSDVPETDDVGDMVRRAKQTARLTGQPATIIDDEGEEWITVYA
jgi:hypothetical protein